uniref:Uncharacterized protein n=1 Tax=Setaria italica TaxID=4555 RepID=K4AHS8_SETIT
MVTGSMAAFFPYRCDFGSSCFRFNPYGIGLDLVAKYRFDLVFSNICRDNRRHVLGVLLKFVF